MDIVVKMKLDCLVALFDLLSQKLVLELGTGCCVHHVVHKQAVNNEILTLTLHDDSLLADDCGVAVVFHAVQDVNVPSAGCLSGSIDALEDLKAVAFGSEP